ncbi:3082_t:CDS:2, partial [Gigaspora rosea]
RCGTQLIASERIIISSRYLGMTEEPGIANGVAYSGGRTAHVAANRGNKWGNEEINAVPLLLGATKIRKMDEGHLLNMDRIDRIETSIAELAKAIQTLIDRKYNPSQRRAPYSNITQNRGSRNLSNSVTPRQNDQVDSPDVSGADMRLFEVTEKTIPKEDEYLMIHVDEDDALFDIRNLRKGQQLNVGGTARASKRRKNEAAIDEIGRCRRNGSKGTAVGENYGWKFEYQQSNS